MFLAQLALEAVGTGALGALALQHLPAPARAAATGERFWPAAFAVGIVATAALQLALTLAGATSRGAHVAALAVALAALAARPLLRGWRPVDAPRSALGLFALYAAYLLLLVGFTPTYATAFTGDWALYWPNVWAYLGALPLEEVRASPLKVEYLVKRTPLLSLYASFWVRLFGLDYPTFQVACLVPDAMLLWAVRAWTLRWGRPGAWPVAGALLALAPAVCRLATVPEPKALGAALVLLALAEYAALRGAPDAEARPWRAAGVGFLAAAAVAAHPSMAFYVVWPFAEQGWRRLYGRPTLGPALPLGAAVVGLLLAGWALWAVKAFGLLALLRPSSTISGEALPPLEYVRAQAGMLLSTAVGPVGLLAAAMRADGPWLARLGDPLLRLYDQSFLFGATLSVGAVATALLARGAGRGEARGAPRALWGALVVGALACHAAHLSIDDPKGHATNLASPLFLAALAAAASALSTLPRPALALVLVGACAELLADRLLVHHASSRTAFRAWAHLHQAAPGGLLGLGPAGKALEPVAWALLWAWMLMRERRYSSSIGSKSTTPPAGNVSS